MKFNNVKFIVILFFLPMIAFGNIIMCLSLNDIIVYDQKYSGKSNEFIKIDPNDSLIYLDKDFNNVSWNFFEIGDFDGDSIDEIIYIKQSEHHLINISLVNFNEDNSSQNYSYFSEEKIIDTTKLDNELDDKSGLLLLTKNQNSNITKIIRIEIYPILITQDIFMIEQDDQIIWKEVNSGNLDEDPFTEIIIFGYFLSSELKRFISYLTILDYFDNANYVELTFNKQDSYFYEKLAIGDLNGDTIDEIYLYKSSYIGLNLEEMSNYLCKIIINGNNIEEESIYNDNGSKWDFISISDIDADEFDEIIILRSKYNSTSQKYDNNLKIVHSYKNIQYLTLSCESKILELISNSKIFLFDPPLVTPIAIVATCDEEFRYWWGSLMWYAAIIYKILNEGPWLWLTFDFFQVYDINLVNVIERTSDPLNTLTNSIQLFNEVKKEDFFSKVNGYLHTIFINYVFDPRNDWESVAGRADVWIESYKTYFAEQPHCLCIFGNRYGTEPDWVWGEYVGEYLYLRHEVCHNFGLVTEDYHKKPDEWHCINICRLNTDPFKFSGMLCKDCQDELFTSKGSGAFGDFYHFREITLHTAASYTGEYTDQNPGYWEIRPCPFMNIYNSEGISESIISGFYVIDGETPVYFNPKVGTQVTVPSSLGIHKLEVNFISDIGNTFHYDASEIEIIDDDVTPPMISVEYIDGDGTDGRPGNIKVFAWDDSGLSVDPSGLYPVSDELDTHFLEFTAIDGDNDRPNDSLTSTETIQVEIVDDDTTHPTIQINYESGDGTDGNPGQFTFSISDTDDGIGGDGDVGFSNIEITVDYVSSDGSNYFTISLPPSEIGSWDLPPNLGTYTITIIATDNDDDRTLYKDSLTTSLTKDQILLDDDTIAPIISNLLVQDNFSNVNFSFDATDDSTGDDSGLSRINIFIDDELVIDYAPTPIETSFTFDLTNDWIMEYGVHDMRVECTDADDDRLDDSLTTIQSTTFEITPDEMMVFILSELDELIDFIDREVFFLFDWVLLDQLGKAECKVQDALNLYNNGSETRSVILDKLAKANLDLMDIITTILEEFLLISEQDGDYISTESHKIRDHITLTMGAIVGTEPALEVANIVIEIEQLTHKVFEEQGLYVALSIDEFLWGAADMLDNALITMSMDYTNISLILVDISKANIKLAGITTYLLEELGTLSEADSDYISKKCHEIRDRITLVMGQIVGTSTTIQIAQIETEIEQFADEIFDTHGLHVALSIDERLWTAAEFLDLTLICLSMNCMCAAEANLLLTIAKLNLTKTIVEDLKTCGDLTEEEASQITGQIDDFISRLTELCDHAQDEGVNDSPTDTSLHSGTDESSDSNSDTSSGSGSTDDPNTDVPTH